MRHDLKITLFTVLWFLFFSPAVVFAFHPLITEEAETQGKAAFEVELSVEYTHDKKPDRVENTTVFGTDLTYGLSRSVDIILEVPFTRSRLREDETDTSADGLSDGDLRIKWLFFEKDGLMLAAMPGLILPFGNDRKGLGSGRVGYSLFAILTREYEDIRIHANAGYVRNETRAEERMNLWHVSVASELEITKNLRLVADIGAAVDENPASQTPKVFLIGGVIYNLTKKTALDAGIKYGVTRTEPDFSILAGITVDF